MLLLQAFPGSHWETAQQDACGKARPPGSPGSQLALHILEAAAQPVTGKANRTPFLGIMAPVTRDFLCKHFLGVEFHPPPPHHSRTQSPYTPLSSLLPHCTSCPLTEAGDTKQSHTKTQTAFFDTEDF